MTKAELTRIIKEELEAVLQESPYVRVTSIDVGYDHEECSKRKNMYIGCSKHGSPRYPRNYYPKGWEHRASRVRRLMRQNPTTWEIFGRVTAGMDWSMLQLHRFMMTDYGPTGADLRQIPQMFIGRISQWTKRVTRLDPLWQYAKEDDKQRMKQSTKEMTRQLFDEAKEILADMAQYFESPPSQSSLSNETRPPTFLDTNL